MNGSGDDEVVGAIAEVVSGALTTADCVGIVARISVIARGISGVNPGVIPRVSAIEAGLRCGEVVASGGVVEDGIVASRWNFQRFESALEVVINDGGGEGFSQAVEGGVGRGEGMGEGGAAVALNDEVINGFDGDGLCLPPVGCCEGDGAGGAFGAGAGAALGDGAGAGGLGGGGLAINLRAINKRLPID